MIYLDNASTTVLDPEVLDAMLPYLRDAFGNPGSICRLGREAKRAVENARTQIAEFIGSEPAQIVFTSGGTESNNTAFHMAGEYLLRQGYNHIITQQTEHASVLRSARRMCADGAFSLSILPVAPNGVVRLSDLKNELRAPKTGFVSVMYVNNETGAENPVPEIGKLCSDCGILFHTDCVQAATSHKLDVGALNCDFLSLSSHKLHGPKGVGALFIRNPEIVSPLLIGGNAQESGLRGGTENVAGIVGFGAACSIMKRELAAVDIHTSALKQIFYRELETQLREGGLDGILHVNGDLVILHGKTVNIRFDGVDAETLLLLLDSHGVCVSAGSACESHESNPSHVLLAMGISPEDARSSIRVSFSKYNTQQEAREAAQIVARCVMQLRA